MRFLIVLLVLLSILSCRKKQVEESFTEGVYKVLDQVVARKKGQLLDYMNRLDSTAHVLGKDELMLAFFHAKREYYRLSKTMEMPEEFKNEIMMLKETIQQHYLANYMIFYDILFIDNNGDIFYTLRKERDYHKNIFSDEFRDTKLSEHLKTNPRESFLDFQYYSISGEPSAFYIEPVMDSSTLKGWFVIQSSINKINNIFTYDEMLGTTGEVILVNKSEYLLTNSRFQSQSTILKQRLSHENISKKFQEGHGHKNVIDYYGQEVLTSFEVFPFMNNEWLIISKITKNEMLTRYYHEHHEKLGKKILDTLYHYPHDYIQHKSFDSNSINVDIDEYRRIDSSGTLFTRGVSTCTALLISYPGKFSYLLHISPFDLLYGGNKTDLLNQVMKQIEYLEILQAEKNKLEFTIISPYPATTLRIIHQLIDKGYFLSQIKSLHNTAAIYANVLYDFDKHETTIVWKTGRNVKDVYIEDATFSETISGILTCIADIN